MKLRKTRAGVLIICAECGAPLCEWRPVEHELVFIVKHHGETHVTTIRLAELERDASA